MKKTIPILGYLLIVPFFIFKLSAQSSIDYSDNSCASYKSLRAKIGVTDDLKLDSVFNILIQNGEKCKEEFLEFSYRRYLLFNEMQIDIITKKLIRILKEENQQLDSKRIDVIGLYNLKEFRYDLAKLVDPDFFSNLKEYYFNYPEPWEMPNPCWPEFDEFRIKTQPIIALIDMGDMVLMAEYLNTLKVIHYQLTQKALSSFEEINRTGKGSFLTDIAKVKEFYRDLRILVSGFTSSDFLDGLFPFARFTLSEMFLYTEGRENRDLMGNFVVHFFLQRLNKDGYSQARIKINQLYYFTCDDTVKEPYLCDEAWNEIMAIYKKARADKSVWRNSMR